MASIKHQFILDCIIRRMRQLGFEPISFEGKSTIVNSLKIPPRVLRHRPDIISINLCHELCVGEGKTNNDVSSLRTKEQLIDYQKAGFFTILGCPASAYYQVKKITEKINREHKNILILKIPDELMPNDEVQF